MLKYKTSNNNILKSLFSFFSNLTNFHPIEVVNRVSEAQLQEGANLNKISWRLTLNQFWSNDADSQSSNNKTTLGLRLMSLQHPRTYHDVLHI